MATDGRVLVFWKLALDVLIAVGIIGSFGMYNLTYMRDFSFSVFDIRYRFTYHTLDAFSQISYSGFKAQYCSPPSTDYTEICDWLRTFQIAGLCYLIVSAVVLVMMVYNFISEMSLMVYCSCKAMQSWRTLHYVEPFIYLIGVLLYALISNIFFLRPPSGTTDDDAAKALMGVWLMVGIFALSCLSALYFLAIRKSIKDLEAASDPFYQALVSRVLNQPDAPVKTVDS